MQFKSWLNEAQLISIFEPGTKVTDDPQVLLKQLMALRDQQKIHQKLGKVDDPNSLRGRFARDRILSPQDGKVPPEIQHALGVIQNPSKFGASPEEVAKQQAIWDREEARRQKAAMDWKPSPKDYLQGTELSPEIMAKVEELIARLQSSPKDFPAIRQEYMKVKSAVDQANQGLVGPR